MIDELQSIFKSGAGSSILQGCGGSLQGVDIRLANERSHS